MKLGFVVNPIAGMGGRVGLKGTDDVVKKAIAEGATPIAPKRATEFLQRLKENMAEKDLQLIVCPSIMGEDEARTANLTFQTLLMKIQKETTAEDTKTEIRLFAEAEVNLIAFVGGDGTAKDVFDAMRDSEKVPVLGVPSGVKMYSGIFAVSPSDAADVVLAFSENQAEVTEFEIMDTDERAARNDHFEVRIHGFLKGPFVPAHIQGSKQLSPETTDEKDNQMAIAEFIVEQIQPEATYILGPGTTVKSVAELLRVKKTVLGVDIYRKGKITLDVNERRILEEIKDWQKTWIVLSPIGRQGILLGRGNQQISPEIVERVGKERIIVASTKSKLQSIEGRVLRVDSGNDGVNNLLRGYIRVVTDYGEWRLVPVQ